MQLIMSSILLSQMRVGVSMIRQGRGLHFGRVLGSGSENNEVTEVSETKTKKPEPMNLAMKHYMDKKRKHDAFIAKEKSDFELGKKHLANIMGMEAEDMTQDKIDSAIEYLFPSGLETESARPAMKSPEEVYPKQKDPEFDNYGRPFHPFFYTAKPNFTQMLYDVVDNIENCSKLNDKLLKEGQKPNVDEVLDETKLAGTKWLSREKLQERLLESVSETEYEELITALERLTFQFYSYKYKDFIYSFRENVAELTSEKGFIPPQFDEHGRAFVEFFGRRRSACAKVKVLKPGTGKMSIIHIDYPDHVNDITYFYGYKERHQILYPLQFTKLLEVVDVECIVYAGGSTSQAGAIRYALSNCLKSFVDKQTIEEMTVLGLLTQNIRVRERKKPGQEGARRKFTWRKR